MPHCTFRIARSTGSRAPGSIPLRVPDRAFRDPPSARASKSNVFGARCALETGRRLIRVSPYCQNTRILSVFRIGRKAAASVLAGGCDPRPAHNRPITVPHPAVSTPSRIAYPRIRKYDAGRISRAGRGAYPHRTRRAGRLQLSRPAAPRIRHRGGRAPQKQGPAKKNFRKKMYRRVKFKI